MTEATFSSDRERRELRIEVQSTRTNASVQIARSLGDVGSSLDGLSAEQVRRQEGVERRRRRALLVRVGPQGREAAPAVLGAAAHGHAAHPAHSAHAAPRAAAARAQVLQNHLHLRLGWRLREDRGVAQHAVIQGHLSL